MNPYMFVINCIPSDRTKARGIVSEGIAHVWVFAQSPGEAKVLACDYIRSLMWIPIDAEHELEISEEQLRDLHPAEFALFQKAQIYGIAMEMIAGMDEQILPDGSHMEFPLDKLIE